MYYVNCVERSNKLLLTYINDKDELIYKKIDNYKPSMYIESNVGEYKELISQKKLEKIKFNNIKECRNYIQANPSNLYGYKSFNYTFLAEYFPEQEIKYEPEKIRGFIIDIECPADRGFPEPTKAEWEINALTIYDTKSETYNVWCTKHFDKYVVKKQLENENINIDSIVVHSNGDSEVKMLKNLLKWWSKNYPAYITGWNTKGFDIPYLVKRLMNLELDENKLSCWNHVYTREYESMGRVVLDVRITGIDDLDYIDVYKKRRLKGRESYRLDFIAKTEGVGSKIDFSETADNLKTLHKIDFNLYTLYNIVDVDVVKRLDDKLGFLNVTKNIAYSSFVNLGDAASPVKTWENLLYVNTIGDKIVLPNKKDNVKGKFEGGYVRTPIAGKHKWVCSFDLNSLYPHVLMGYNISPETMLPNKIHNINVDTMEHGIPYNKPDGDVSVCPSGYTFRNDKEGLLGRLCDKLYSERKEIKKEMLQHEQKVVDSNVEIKKRDINGSGNFKPVGSDKCISEMSDTELLRYRSYHDRQATLKDGRQHTKKISMNSLYGALGEASFIFYDLRLAESVTLSAQLASRWIAIDLMKSLRKLLKLDDKEDWIVYGDTDSIYVTFDKIVEMKHKDSDTHTILDFLDNFCKTKIEPFIERSYLKLQEYTNAYKQKMVMKREVISDNSIFLKKKIYALNVLDSEGVRFDVAELKIMGMHSVVKSSSPAKCRELSKKALSIIVNGNESDFQKYVIECENIIRGMKAEELAYPRGVTSIDKYLNVSLSDRNLNALNYKLYTSDAKSVPIHSRATILYNILINQLGLDVERIYEGDKMKFIYMKRPNMADSDVIGFIDVLPKEFKMDGMIDYDKMIEGTFLKAMRGICDIIGWNVRKTYNLFDLLEIQ